MSPVGPGRAGQVLVQGGGQRVCVRYLGRVGGCGAMMGVWGPLSGRTLLPVTSLVLVRGVWCPGPGCSGGWRGRPG
jgi:hypothetical protein